MLDGAQAMRPEQVRGPEGLQSDSLGSCHLLRQQLRPHTTPILHEPDAGTALVLQMEQGTPYSAAISAIDMCCQLQIVLQKGCRGRLKRSAPPPCQGWPAWSVLLPA